MQTKPNSPTPWRVVDISGDDWMPSGIGATRIETADGYGVATTEFGLTKAEAAKYRAAAEADAALIVEAVNAHASLTARVAELERENALLRTIADAATPAAVQSIARMAELEGALEALRDPQNFRTDPTVNTLRNRDAALNRARALLANKEG